MTAYKTLLLVNGAVWEERTFPNLDSRCSYLLGIGEVKTIMTEFELWPVTGPMDICAINVETLHSDEHYRNSAFRQSTHPRHYNGPEIEWSAIRRQFSEEDWTELLAHTVPQKIDWNHPVFKSSE